MALSTFLPQIFKLYGVYISADHDTFTPEPLKAKRAAVDDDAKHMRADTDAFLGVLGYALVVFKAHARVVDQRQTRAARRFGRKLECRYDSFSNFAKLLQNNTLRAAIVYLYAYSIKKRRQGGLPSSGIRNS